MNIVVCWKHVPRRIEVHPLTAAITPDRQSWGPSPADEAALELALRFGEGPRDEVTVVCAGGPEVEAMLREALATGADVAIRCPAAPDADSAAVAEALARVAHGADLVLCGDHSLDRGSGSVPAFVAAELGARQALGAVAVRVGLPAGSGPLLVVDRRLDRGRRERLRVALPAVVSVEGSLVRLRRAPLPGVISATAAAIGIGPEVAMVPKPVLGEYRPFRPRTRPRALPVGDGPHARILDITRATEERTPPRLVRLDAPEAATAIADQLRDWGYL